MSENYMCILQRICKISALKGDRSLHHLRTNFFSPVIQPKTILHLFPVFFHLSMALEAPAATRLAALPSRRCQPGLLLADLTLPLLHPCTLSHFILSPLTVRFFNTTLDISARSDDASSKPPPLPSFANVRSPGQRSYTESASDRMLLRTQSETALPKVTAGFTSARPTNAGTSLSRFPRHSPSFHTYQSWCNIFFFFFCFVCTIVVALIYSAWTSSRSPFPCAFVYGFVSDVIDLTQAE
jgi:hypothetical protein